ncbi:MAG: 3-deoxy-7-phosphoheptulonate synthase class II [Bryobacterales bacterium]|nr:3-deoxy-7-phosphoheptulonate synthase class II [Bryobacterales bacterium]
MKRKGVAATTWYSETLSFWSPESWQSKPTLQQPVYQSHESLERVAAELASLPPLVTAWEIDQLKAQFSEAAEGRRFILQGGDCAERLGDCNPQTITNKLKILLQMSLVLIHGSKKPVVRVGRFAGQYAKPRSEDFEKRDGVTLPSYRGDLTNRPEFTESARRPDPELLLRGYERAALTLNFVRSLVRGGFADLHHPEYWRLDFVKHSPLAEEYERIVGAVTESLRFMENVLGLHPGEIEWVDFFTSHEALHLTYESAQTREVPYRHGWHNLSTHFPWIGMRTAALDGGHVEYMRGIRNPIGVKIGPGMTRDWLLKLIDVLHPDNEKGRLVLIHRLGRLKIAERLPELIETVRESGKQVVWICDPMHGNTRATAAGRKTRYFEDILRELELAFDLHAANKSVLAGVHFELTGEDVTECVGGARGLTEEGLAARYETEVDPRLNYEQALELALLTARKMMLGASAR